MTVNIQRNPKKLPIYTSIEVETIEAIDLIAAMRGWRRPQTIRHLLNGLVPSLLKIDHKKTPWYSSDTPIDVQRITKKLPIFVSVDIKTVEGIDTIAKTYGWDRPQALRLLLNGLIHSMQKTGHDKSPWCSFDEFEINPTFGEFEIKRK